MCAEKIYGTTSILIYAMLTENEEPGSKRPIAKWDSTSQRTIRGLFFKSTSKLRSDATQFVRSHFSLKALAPSPISTLVSPFRLKKAAQSTTNLGGWRTGNAASTPPQPSLLHPRLISTGITKDQGPHRSFRSG